jgi:kynurenine formamidase
VLLGGVGTAVAAAFPASALAVRPAKGRFQDLTHVFTEGFPVFTFDPPTRETLVTIPTAGFYAQKWTFGEHSGTHMDAPGHFVLGGRLSPEITPQELIVPIVVIDISARAATNPDAVVTVDDVRGFERRHGRIPDGALACMNSGWAAKVDDPLAFKCAPSFPGYHFPGFSLDAAMWLAEERDVTGIGVDTLSLDPGNSSTFPVHVNLPRHGPVRPREPEQPRQDPAARRARLRRVDPLGGGLGRTLPRDCELVAAGGAAVNWSGHGVPDARVPDRRRSVDLGVGLGRRDGCGARGP